MAIDEIKEASKELSDHLSSPEEVFDALVNRYPVPRCETCSWWVLLRTPAGRCDALQIATHDQFSCVLWKAR